MAVTRRSAGWSDGIRAFGPAKGIDLAAALRAQCLGGPLSARETDRGRLVPGARADLVVIPAAAVAEPVEPGGPLGSTRPRLVLVDGRVAAEA
jgi:predicted amidohydrolase YtcJ